MVGGFTVTHYYNDKTPSGLARCKLCHWTFDSGLVGFDDNYKVIIARSINRDGNLPGHIQQFAHRPMILPGKECYYTATDNLAWHRHRYTRGMGLSGLLLTILGWIKQGLKCWFDGLLHTHQFIVTPEKYIRILKNR